MAQAGIFGAAAIPSACLGRGRNAGYPAPPQVTGGGRPPPRSHRTRRADFPHRALRQLIHSTASACSSRYGRRSLGRSSGERCLIWLKASHVR